MQQVFTNVCKNIRCYSTKTRNFKEIKIPIQWGHIAGKWWEPYDSRPILALHGWQDNCGSFDRLIPLLKMDVGFLTIDLPGHGYSSRIPPGMYYNNLDTALVIQHIANFFAWTKISLMGHSLGAILSYCYTMLFPDDIDYLICIDGIKPLQKKNNAVRMAEGIRELIKYDSISRSTKKPPSYELNEIKRLICSLNDNSVAFEHAETILKRNIAEAEYNPGKFYITRDPRLKSRLIFNWDQQELIEYAKRVTCPLFLCKFTGSGYYEDKQNFYDILEVLKKVNNQLDMHYVEGTHHSHLNNPTCLNALINNFIEKYNTGNREAGGIKDEIIANDIS